jgi:hypothetical protein
MLLGEILGLCGWRLAFLGEAVFVAAAAYQLLNVSFA